MLCPNCKENDITVMTNIIVSMPFDFMNNLTKMKIRSKDFQIFDIDKKNADWICPKCGLIRKGKG